MSYCKSYYLCIKTRYTLSYLRAHRIGPDRLYDPGRFFPRSGRFTPIAPLKFFIQNRRCTSGFFLGDSSPLVRFTSACQLGTPAPPSGPLPRCGWEPPAVRGRRGPSLPAVPCLPHLRKTHLLRKLLRNLFQGVSPPAKGRHFAQVRGLPEGRPGRSLPLPVDSRGASPPHHPPDLSRGAEAASLSVGARLRPSAGSAPSPALRRLRRSAPGAAPPLAGSATAPPSIWCGACAPEAAEPSARPPSHTPL